MHIQQNLKNFKKSMESSPVMKRGDYDYFVNPITDGIPRMDPIILEEVIDGLKGMSDFDCDLIVAPEAMGIPIAVPLSLKLGIPYNIMRKKQYGFPGEVTVTQVTGYSKTDLHINGISKGDRVVIVDVVVSTGGTIKAMIQGLRSAGAEVVDVLVALQKGDGKKLIEDEFGISIKALVKIELRDNKVKVLD